MTNKYDIATTMIGIMASPKYQATFAKPQPQFSKTAADKAKKEEEGEEDAVKACVDFCKKIMKESECGGSAKPSEGKCVISCPDSKVVSKCKAYCKKKGVECEIKQPKASKEQKAKAKGSKKAKAYQACVIGLAKISEMLDNAGLAKESAYTLMALDGLVRNAQTITDGYQYPMDEEKQKQIQEASRAFDSFNANDCDSNDIYHAPATSDEASGAEESLDFLGLDDADFSDEFSKWQEDWEDEEEDVREKMDEEDPSSYLDIGKLIDEQLEGYEAPELGTKALANKKINSLMRVALDINKTLKSTAAEKSPKAKVRNKAEAIFDNKHSKVTDDKDHFPIDTIGRARNALARVNQYDSAPEWWKGSLKELQNAVVKAVHAKYPSIKVSDKAKKPGKG